MSIKWIACENDIEIGSKVSEIFIEQIKTKPSSVFILATGSSPMATYKAIIKDHLTNHTSWKQVTTFNLDEYLNIDQKYIHQSYRYFMDDNLFNHINIDKKNTFFPNQSLIGDKYQQMMNHKGEVDICLLGVGNNGHIAFNEPGTKIDAMTHVVDLTESSRLANSRFFDNDINNVPKQAVTTGLKEILNSKKIILIATGKNKKTAIEHLKTAKNFDEQWPITALTKHPDVIVFLQR